MLSMASIVSNSRRQLCHEVEGIIPVNEDAGSNNPPSYRARFGPVPGLEARCQEQAKNAGILARKNIQNVIPANAIVDP